CATCTARCFDGLPPGRRPAADAAARPLEPPGGDPRRNPAAASQCRAFGRRNGCRLEADREPRPQDAADPASPPPGRVSRLHRPRYCPAALWWRPRRVYLASPRWLRWPPARLLRFDPRLLQVAPPAPEVDAQQRGRRRTDHLLERRQRVARRDQPFDDPA